MVHLQADKVPDAKALAALDDIVRAVHATWDQHIATEAGLARWEDDGGAPGPWPSLLSRSTTTSLRRHA